MALQSVQHRTPSILKNIRKGTNLRKDNRFQVDRNTNIVNTLWKNRITIFGRQIAKLYKKYGSGKTSTTRTWKKDTFTRGKEETRVQSKRHREGDKWKSEKPLVLLFIFPPWPCKSKTRVIVFTPSLQSRLSASCESVKSVVIIWL